MDISKLSPPGLPTNQTETPPSKQRLLNETAAAITQDLRALEKLSVLSDHADIRPLDTTAGLHILLAEIRAVFELTAQSMGDTDPTGDTAAIAPSPIQTARQIVEWVLQSLPDNAGDPVLYTAALLRSESALQVGLRQATATVSNWHDVPEAVVDAVKLSGIMVLQVLSDERPNPLWLRPEWVGLAPRLERFWRRRRAARRRLTDPDHWQGGLDDHDEQRS